MNNSNIEAEISFRFLSLYKFQAYSLVREILGATHKEDVESNLYIAYVPLTKQNFEDAYQNHMKMQVSAGIRNAFRQGID